MRRKERKIAQSSSWFTVSTPCMHASPRYFGAVECYCPVEHFVFVWIRRDVIAKEVSGLILPSGYDQVGQPSILGRCLNLFTLVDTTPWKEKKTRRGETSSVLIPNARLINAHSNALVPLNYTANVTDNGDRYCEVIDLLSYLRLHNAVSGRY